MKHKKILLAASFTDMAVGIFLVLCGLLEFMGVLKTPAINSLQTFGIQLSYAVFISGILVLVSGFVTYRNRKKFQNINVLMIMGLVSMVFPLVVAFALLIQRHLLCLRLFPTIFTSIFYMVSVLIFKLANADVKSHKIATSKMVVGAKRKQGFSIQNLIKRGSKKNKGHSSHVSSSLSKLTYSGQRRRRKRR